jgi:hypothetical protein
MVLKSVFATSFCVALLAWSGLSAADEYLGLAPPSALLSPKPLGPPAHFVPGPLDVNVDQGGGAQARAQPTTEPEAKSPEAKSPEAKSLEAKSLEAKSKAEPKISREARSKAEPKTVTRQTRVARARAEKPVVHARAEKPVLHARAEIPRAAAKTKLARRHGNPLDAQAFDTRIQVWPCRSGGICNWKR